MFSPRAARRRRRELLDAGSRRSCAPATRWRSARCAPSAGAGLAVPGDVSVVGYDDSAFMTYTDPPLTTVRQPIEAMGRAAVDRLVSQLEGRRDGPRELLFAPELVVRASTGGRLGG